MQIAANGTDCVWGTVWAIIRALPLDELC